MDEIASIKHEDLKGLHATSGSRWQDGGEGWLRHSYVWKVMKKAG